MGLYHLCDTLSEALIYLTVISSVWAFGTTTHATIWAAVVAGHALGALLLAKIALRRGGYRPSLTPVAPAGFHYALVVLTVLLVGFCFISALNARACYDVETAQLLYRPFIKWLPHSLDASSSWFAFWKYSALAWTFWSIADWLRGKTPRETRALRQGEHSVDNTVVSARLQRLLWVLGVNGALVALEGIVQRLSGTAKLLWLLTPRINADAAFMFGPYAYRANAAQLFNLLWPATLGFWWVLRLQTRSKTINPMHHLLLLCVCIMVVSPMISNSRGGALIAFAILMLATGMLLVGGGRRHALLKLGISCLCGLTIVIATHLGWAQFNQRMEAFGSGLQDREQIYAMARPMARDYPLFGTGPGTFNTLFQFYRTSPDDYWPAQLHNDWLETRITFGWFGSSLIALSLLTVLGRWFGAGGLRACWQFTSLLWLALAGCLLHARFDFPFQVYSITLTFLVLCAVLFSLSREPGAIES